MHKTTKDRLGGALLVALGAATVSAGIGYGPGTVVGGMGVVGPTRMDYPGTMAAVHAVARYVGEILAGR